MNGNNMIPIAPAASYPVSKTIDIQRKKRTRAKRSCDKCRIKKTRCDADIHQPCTKCRLSGYECSFLVEQKKRGPASGSYVEVLENRLQRMEKLLQNIAKEKQSDTDSDTNSLESPVVDTESSPSCAHHGCPQLHEGPSLEDNMEKLTLSDYERTRYIGASSGVHLLNTELFSSNKIHRIPDDPKWVIQKLNLEEDEHVIIKSKKITAPETTETKNYTSINRAELFKDVPKMNQDFTDYLIHMYFTRVHNYCPVINKVQFLEQYYFHKPTPPDKYILYVIAYVGVSIFTPNILNTQVFQLTEEQLKEIEEILKAKSHQILNFVYKRSMVSTVQALMLLSMFMQRGEIDDEDTSHWFISGMAIRMAQDLGLHRDCSKWPIPDYEIELRRRIWYAAYLMDRWVAADLGRPISIIDNDFEVELPTPYELNYESTLLEQQMTPILILEAEEARQNNKPIYSSFVQLVTLSQIAGQVLVGLHSPRAKQTRENSIELVNILDRNLANWKAQLPRELQVDMSDPQFYFSTMAGVVNLAHGCILLLLYRPFIKKYSEENSEDSNLAIKALGICTATATEILTIVEAMERDYFVALPWNMSVYCIFQAAIIFLHNAKGGNTFFKEHGRQNLVRCAKVYQHDPFLQNTRAIKVLENLVLNFDVFLGESSGSNSPANNKQQNKQQFGSPFASKLDLHGSVKPTSMDFVLEDNSFNPSTYFPTPSPQQQPSPDNKTEPSSGAPTESALPNRFIKTLRHFESTRPEDMFTSSLSLGLGKDIMPLPTEQQQTYPAATDASNEFPHQCNQLAFDFNPPVVGQQQQQQQQPLVYLETRDQTNDAYHAVDLASLCSQVPLWDVPSGISWNDWESFMKTNANV